MTTIECSKCKAEVAFNDAYHDFGGAYCGDCWPSVEFAITDGPAKLSKATRLAKLLAEGIRQLEWSNQRRCPACLGGKPGKTGSPVGHNPAHCWLAALLDECRQEGVLND